MEQMNKHRHIRTLGKAGIVFRRMPANARAPKHLLSEPSKGPYAVVANQRLAAVF